MLSAYQEHGLVVRDVEERNVDERGRPDLRRRGIPRLRRGTERRVEHRSRVGVGWRSRNHDAIGSLARILGGNPGLRERAGEERSERDDGDHRE
jgi:hypothetical protein